MLIVIFIFINSLFSGSTVQDSKCQTVIIEPNSILGIIGKADDQEELVDIAFLEVNPCILLFSPVSDDSLDILQEKVSRNIACSYLDLLKIKPINLDHDSIYRYVRVILINSDGSLTSDLLIESSSGYI